MAVGKRVRDIYAATQPNEARLRRVVDDTYIEGDVSGLAPVPPS